MLDVCLLGTGGMMPLINRWLTSLLVRFNGRMLLIDCGEGTQIPLKMADWGFKNIDAVLFTHYHADHIAGLPGFLLTLGNSGREETLTLMGPPGLREFVAGLTVICPVLPYDLQIVELSNEQITEMKFADFYIKSLPVDHTLPCLAYSIEIKRQGKFDAEQAKKLSIPLKYWSTLQKGSSIVVEDRIITPEMVLGEARKGIKIAYCTDTRPVEGLADFIQAADLLVCEGMYGDEKNQDKACEKKHMMFAEAAAVAKAGNVKELWLTHYSPSLTDPNEYLAAAGNVFANTLAGQDLLSKTFKYSD